MDLRHPTCFVTATEELHFGPAAQRLAMPPAAFTRTTRTVRLTTDGSLLPGKAQRLLADAEAMRSRFRDKSRALSRTLRMGAMDSAAAGLVPPLLDDFRRRQPGVTVELFEDRSIRLLPKPLSVLPRLPLAAAWIRNSRDAPRDTLFDNIGQHGAGA